MVIQMRTAGSLSDYLFPQEQIDQEIVEYQKQLDALFKEYDEIDTEIVEYQKQLDDANYAEPYDDGHPYDPRNTEIIHEQNRLEVSKHDVSMEIANTRLKIDELKDKRPENKSSQHAQQDEESDIVRSREEPYDDNQLYNSVHGSTKDAFMKILVEKIANWNDSETEDAARMAEEVDQLMTQYLNSPGPESPEADQIFRKIDEIVGQDPELREMLTEIVDNHSGVPGDYRRASKDENLFEVIDELDDLQDEVEEDEEDKKNEKKSSTEDMWDQDKWRVANTKNDKISDEGWLV